MPTMLPVLIVAWAYEGVGTVERINRINTKERGGVLEAAMTTRTMAAD